MTTYYETVPVITNAQLDWDDPTIWNQQSVPDTANDGVIIDQGFNDVFINSGETYQINSLQVSAYNILVLEGTLSLVDNANISSDGTIDLYGGKLSAEHIVIGGVGISGIGTVISSGGLEDQSNIASEANLYVTGQTTLTVEGATFYVSNSGLLNAFGGSTLLAEATQPGGFLNFSSGELSGGTYENEEGGTLHLKTDGVVTVDNATITFWVDNPDNGTVGTIASYDPTSGQFIPIQDSLTTITSSGILNVETGQFISPNSITVEGALRLYGGASLTTQGLTTAPGGTITFYDSGPETLSVAQGPIQDNGVITALTSGTSITLTIDAAVAGSGSIVVGPQTFDLYGLAAVTIDLESAVSTSVAFSDGTGTVILGAPQQFTGTFDSFVPGDSIILSGVNVSAVTGFSYAGSTTSGILTIDEGSKAINIAFSGDYTTQSFSLAAGAQSTPSVVIHETGSTQNPLTVHPIAANDHVPVIGVPALTMA